MIKFKCHWTEIFTTTKKAKFQFHAGSTLAADAAVTQTLSPRLKEKSKTIRLILLLLNFGSVVFFHNLKAYNGVFKQDQISRFVLQASRSICLYVIP